MYYVFRNAHTHSHAITIKEKEAINVKDSEGEGTCKVWKPKKGGEMMEL